jgi:SHS2 domain-containing protein
VSAVAPPAVVQATVSAGGRESVLRALRDLLAHLPGARVARAPRVRQHGAAWTARFRVAGAAVRDVEEALRPFRGEPGLSIVMATRLGPPAPGTPWALPPRFPCRVLAHDADERFEVRARDRADLLAAAAEALAALVVAPMSVRPAQARRLEVRVPAGGAGDDDRLFQWLAEVLYLVDHGRFAPRRVAVTRDDEECVRGVVLGAPVDPSRHQVHGTVKAITYHGLEVGPAQDGTWRARVLVDV